MNVVLILFLYSYVFGICKAGTYISADEVYTNLKIYIDFEIKRLRIQFKSELNETKAIIENRLQVVKAEVDEKLSSAEENILKLQHESRENGNAVYRLDDTIVSKLKEHKVVMEKAFAQEKQYLRETAKHLEGTIKNKVQILQFAGNDLGFIQGPPGAPGIQGPIGEPGPRGPSGYPGEMGTTGLRGFPGSKGEIGPPGKEGQRGSKGNRGEKGTTGFIGFPGSNGEIGSPGKQGQMGPTGRKGPKGTKGEDGILGLRGRKGERGDDGLSGADGKHGPPGQAGLRGLPGLNGSQGQPGPKGPKGDRGKIGRPNFTGVPGFPGTKGEIGPPGKGGQRGLTGTKGSKGDRGLTGYTGFRGAKGQKGSPEKRNSVYFHLSIPTDQTLSQNTILKFDNVFYNRGSGYNSTTGIFTAPYSGVYLFLFFVRVGLDEYDIAFLNLYVNRIYRAYTIVESHHDDHNAMAGNAYVSYMAAGDKAWIQTGFITGKAYHDLQKEGTTFTGILVN